MSDEFDVGAEIVKSVKDVFATMLMIDLESEPPVVNEKVAVQSNLTSMIGLGGGIRGMLAIHCPKIVATDITASFLGMEVTDMDEDVKDAIGEIANMVAGNLKVAYASQDINLELAIPTTIVGDSFTISGMVNSQRVVAPLKMNGNPFWIEYMYVNAA